MTTEGRRHNDTERHIGLDQQSCGDQAQRLALAFQEASTPESQGDSVEVCVCGGVSRAAAQPVRTGVDTCWLFPAPEGQSVGSELEGQGGQSTCPSCPALIIFLCTSPPHSNSLSSLLPHTHTHTKCAVFFWCFQLPRVLRAVMLCLGFPFVALNLA